MIYSEYVIRIAEIENRQKARKRAKEEFRKNANRVYNDRLAAAKVDYYNQIESYEGKYRAEQDADEQLKLQLRVEYIQSKEVAEAALSGG